MRSAQSYATFILWFSSQLFEELPEVGNLEKPKLVFFFDEAHLLFTSAPRALVEKIEQVVRLIRSKGVGIYFVTQNPADLPDTVLSQLGNRVQHALRAFTTRDQQALRKSVQTYRPNPRFNIADAIRDVGVGEAITSFLEQKGAPGIAERTLSRPPAAGTGPITDGARQMLMLKSPVAGKYEKTIDSDSAHEMRLKTRPLPMTQRLPAPVHSPQKHPQGGVTRWFKPFPNHLPDRARRTNGSSLDSQRYWWAI